MEKVLKYASIGLASLGIGLGVAAADSADIGTTGPDSKNKIEISKHHDVDVDNNNNVGVNNDNDQKAKTGDAKAYDNTTAGDARSGDAENSNDTSTEVKITNAGGGSWAPMWGNGSASASIDNTGPDSYNSVKFHYSSNLDVNNNNSVNVTNNNDQYARSGSASVKHNTTGGDAVSGSATNTNSTSTSVHISN